MDLTAQTGSAANTILLQRKGRVIPSGDQGHQGCHCVPASSHPPHPLGRRGCLWFHWNDAAQGLRGGTVIASCLGGQSRRVTATQWAGRQSIKPEDSCPALRADGTCLAVSGRAWDPSLSDSFQPPIRTAVSAPILSLCLRRTNLCDSIK